MAIPRAPTFCPDEEQFRDPIAYIESIRPLAQRYGIIKIKPPQAFSPEFGLPWTKRFVKTRRQNIHQLRDRLTPAVRFMLRVIPLWREAGFDKHLPRLGGREVDLYSLYRIVNEFGGYDAVTQSRKWIQVGRRLRLDSGCTSMSFQLRSAYETYLQPFLDDGLDIDAFLTGELPPKKISGVKQERKETQASAGRTAAQGNAGVSGGKTSPLPSPRPQRTKVGSKSPASGEADSSPSRKRHRKLAISGVESSAATLAGQAPSDMDSAVREYVMREFGFEEGKTYTLEEYKARAESYLSSHFRALIRKERRAPTVAEIEAEYWRIVNGGEERVVVEYGSELNTLEVGSGFSMAGGESDPYHYWNLMEIARAPGSPLRHLADEIAGVTKPWLYIGMPFATFCWHNEDNYLYSINYSHLGGAKVWYGVPGASAEVFERIMQSEAPELFARDPQLLFKLITMLSPELLRARNCPVYRLVQSPGEFVVTFPQAYHGGFSAEFNVCEAVNFASPHWFRYGRYATERYRKFGRESVVSAEHLLMCEVLRSDLNVLLRTNFLHRELRQLLRRERALRAHCHTLGITEEYYLTSTDLPEDMQCMVCNQMCFSSVVESQECPKVYACPLHASTLQRKYGGRLFLLVRHSLPELHDLINFYLASRPELAMLPLADVEDSGFQSDAEQVV